MRLSRRLAGSFVPIFVTGLLIPPAASRGDAIVDLSKGGVGDSIIGGISDLHTDASTHVTTSSFHQGVFVVPLTADSTDSLPTSPGSGTSDDGTATVSAGSSKTQHFTPSNAFPTFSHFATTINGQASAGVDPGQSVPADFAYEAQASLNTQVFFHLDARTNYLLSGDIAFSTVGNPDNSTAALGQNTGGRGGIGFGISNRDQTLTFASDSAFSTGGFSFAFGPYPNFSFSGTLDPGDYRLDISVISFAGVGGSVRNASTTSGLNLDLNLTPAVPLPSSAAAGGVLIVTLAGTGYLRRGRIKGT